MSDMKRRKFITLLGGAAAAWPIELRAQEPGRTYRLGGLTPSPRDAPHYAALFDELRKLGFIEGHFRLQRNVRFLHSGEESVPQPRSD